MTSPADGPGAHLEYPPEVRAALAYARRLEWWTILWLLATLAMLAPLAGSSQVVRSNLVDVALGLLPPSLFLVATSLESRPPTRAFPYGFHRTASLAFFASAGALTAAGGLLVFEAASTLLSGERPSIGSVRLLGQEVWLGWLMMPALAAAAIPPVILGRMKRRPSEVAFDKVLVTDAELNAGDWKSNLAGIVGLVGVAWGFWWADAAAAGIISVSILRDGLGALRTAIAELVDGAPRELRSARLSPECEALAARVEAFGPGAALQLRETGRLITGVLRSADPDDLGRLTGGLAEGFGWRVRDVAWRPLDDPDP